jgi:hypothetical protein
MPDPMCEQRKHPSRTGNRQQRSLLNELNIECASGKAGNILRMATLA